MDFALKVSFPDYKPLAFRSVNTEDRKASELTTHTQTPTPRQACRRVGCVQHLVHLFNSGLLYRGGTFFILFRLSYFPLAFRLFPWELIRTLASENKTRPY